MVGLSIPSPRASSPENEQTRVENVSAQRCSDENEENPHASPSKQESRYVGVAEFNHADARQPAAPAR